MACQDPIRQDILHLLAYHYKNYDDSVLSIHNEENRPTHSINHYPILPASVGLDLLPVEMLSAVLRFSDLHTLSTLRLVNRRTKVVVEGFIPYKLIKLHAPYVLDALTRTGVASHFTAVQVFDVFCSDSCAICGKFGAFLWIPGCIRCCIPCVRESQELLPMTQRDAKAAFGLSQKALSKVPIVHTLPGIYTLLGTQYKRRKWLLSRGKAREIAVEVHGGEEGLISYITSNTSRAKAAYDQRVAKRNATRSAFDSKGERNITIDDISRFLVTTRLPYFNSELRSTQTGLSCKGCQAALEAHSKHLLSCAQLRPLFDMRDRTYTEDMFLDHFAICTEAQRMWAEHRGTNDRI